MKLRPIRRPPRPFPVRLKRPRRDVTAAAAKPLAVEAGRPARRGLRGNRATRPLVTIVASMLVLLPIFSSNALGTVDQAFFKDWDHFSEGLVLAKIESTTPGAIAPAAGRIGLVLALPNPIAPYDTFDGLESGAKSTSSSYAEYRVQLGLQGFLFTGLYHVGCDSVSCLETVNSGLTAAALIGFALLLGLVAPRSFGIVFMVTSVSSPWIIASAKNLYWVPWSFFLPAMATILFIRAATRRRRVITAAAVFALFVLRFGMGFEFLTSIALFAAGMPLIAHVFTPRYRRFREAFRDAALILGLSVVAFVITLVVTCLVTNRGDLTTGLLDVYQHAAIRTYGGTSTDPVTALSLAASPVDVLGIYVFNWTTSVVELGWGAPLDIAFGPHSLFPLIIGAVLVIVSRLLKKDVKWRRDAVVLVVALIAPVSWIVLAKSHAFVHTPIDFVLWYLLGVSSIFWILIAWVLEKLPSLLVLAVARVRSAAVPPTTAAASVAAVPVEARTAVEPRLSRTE